MNCLCCGKTLKNDDGTGWHKACVKRFFTTTKLPDIDIDDQKLKVLAEESINKGYTVPGVQKKLSLHLLSEPGNPRLTLVNYPTGYILKPQVDQFKAMPEAEQLVMSMADMIGISTVPHALIKGNGQMAYITKRVVGYSRKQLLKCLQWKISVSWTIVLHRTNIKVHTSDAQKS